MGHVFGSYGLSVVYDGYGLKYTFRAYRDGVGAVAEHVAENHIFDALVIILLRYIECGVPLGSEVERAFFDSFQLGW